jgi:N-acetylglucosamine kinase-like BadF-type ATPase
MDRTDPDAHGEAVVLGVDGGGTQTTAWIAPLSPSARAEPLGQGTAGPGNPRTYGFDVAQRNMAVAVAQAQSDAQRNGHFQPETTHVVAACLGISGAGREVERRELERWALQSGLAQLVQVTHDAEIVLATASPLHTGIALISGTGSLAWGRNVTGQTGRTGGWGYLIGDEGSGYAIAIAALRAAACAADGRGPATLLLPRLMDELQARQSHELISRLYQAEMSRDRIAQLTSVVFRAAAEDPVAAGIISRAAGDLAVMVATLQQQLQLPASDLTLALAGGVLAHQESLRSEVVARLQAYEISPAATVVVAAPAAGAVALARRLARGASVP